jgi:hypothetical protein
MITNLNRRPKRRKIETSTDPNKSPQLPVKQEAKSEIPYFPPSASSVNLLRPLSALNLNISKKKKIYSYQRSILQKIQIFSRNNLPLNKSIGKYSKKYLQKILNIK